MKPRTCITCPRRDTLTALNNQTIKKTLKEFKRVENFLIETQYHNFKRTRKGKQARSVIEVVPNLF